MASLTPEMQPEESSPEQNLAVKVRSAYKKYSSTWVLKGLDMTVPVGTIYGLLGPSGCGKSTLLNCIVGRMALDSGSISVQCKHKNQLGYMPQATALYTLLSVGEMLRYYGQLLNLSPAEISKKSSQIVKLLDLPPLHRIVETLSGGQQRRVSLAVALLNDPKILILDEPTVGLDPVLSDGIWKHLLKITKQYQKTVVITTHYIEEARQANTVGLMRGGVLLSESSPQSLLSTQGCDTLEEAFLKLCYTQEKNNNTIPENAKEPVNVSKIEIKDDRPFLHNESFFNYYCLKAEVTKNCIFIWRNKALLPFLAFLPFIVCVLFNYTIGTIPEGLKIGVVNNEVSDINYCFDEHFKGCNFSDPISCRILQNIGKSSYFNMIEFESFSEALSMSKSMKLWAVVGFPTNFTENMIERFNFNLNTGDHVVSQGQVALWIDKSDYYISTLLTFFIQQGLLKGLEEFFNDCNWPTETFNIPMKFETPIFGEIVPSITKSTSPSMIIIIIFYLPMSYTIGVLMQEKLSGVLERSMVSGLKITESFIGHTIIQVGIMVAQIVIIILTIYVWFRHPFNGPLVYSTALLVLQGLCGLAFGFLVSIVCDKIMPATYISVGVTIGFVFLSGTLWPQEGIHYMMQWIRPLVPISYSVEALRSLTVRAWPITHYIVLKGFISIGFWILVYVITAHYVEKWRNAKPK